MKDNHNPGGYITFLVIMTLNILFFVYISLIHTGVKNVDKVGPVQAVQQGTK